MEAVVDRKFVDRVVARRVVTAGYIHEMDKRERHLVEAVEAGYSHWSAVLVLVAQKGIGAFANTIATVVDGHKLGAADFHNCTAGGCSGSQPWRTRACRVGTKAKALT